MNIDHKKIFFQNYVEFQISMRTKRGKSWTGTAPNLNVSVVRAKNVLVCASMAKKEFFHKKKFKAMHLTAKDFLFFKMNFLNNAIKKFEIWVFI